MSKLSLQFDNFVDSLNIEELSFYEKKIINLIRDNFDEISSKGTSNGSRAKCLSRLVVELGNTISDEIEKKSNSTKKQAFPIEKLHSLKLESFRGFSNEEEFDLNRKFIFIYGPNGSGKSSFCEALEYSMLGYINEAAQKRIPEKNILKIF